MYMIKKSRLAKLLKVEGLVLYPFIFFASASPSPKIIRHELIHINQIRSCGVFKFYFRYIKEYLSNRKKGLDHFNAYYEISYEKEAYQNQDNENVPLA